MSGQRSRSSRLQGALLIILFCVAALALRWLYYERLDLPYPVRADARDYFVYAYNLVHFGTYSKALSEDKPRPDAWRSPGYPLIVAAALSLGGLKRYYDLMIHFQIVLSSLCVPMTYFVGRRFMPNWAALTAAGLVALSPHLISTAANLLTETLFAFVLLAGIRSYYWAVEKKRILPAVVSGLLFGYAYLINETCLFLPLVFAVCTAWLSKVRDAPSIFNANLRLMAILLLVFSLFPAAWLLRNSRLPQGALKGSGRAVATMSHGAYPGFVYEDSTLKYYPYEEDPRQPDFGASLDNFIDILWDRFKQRPLRYLSWYLLEKPYHLWSWNNLQSDKGATGKAGRGDIYIYPVRSSLYLESKPADLTRVLMKGLHPVIAFLACAGVFICLFRAKANRSPGQVERSPVYLFAVLLYYTLLYTVFAPWPRYSVPLRPELYLSAMWVLAVMQRRFFGGSKITTSAGVT